MRGKSNRESRVTILLPVYNGMPYLPSAVESILAQSFTDFTLLIINDGSSDQSAKYIESLSDPRIVVINQANRGLGATLNAGLLSCQSEYIARMDADDISLPDRIGKQVSYLDSRPEIAMIGTQVEFLVGDKIQRGLRAPIDHDRILARLFQGQAGLCHPSVMFRRKAAIECGGYPIGVIGEDIDFFLKMCEEGHAANLDEVLLKYRLHTSQLCQARSRELISGNLYAAHRALCRVKRLPEPSFEAFLAQASLISRCRWFIEAWELTQYRKARMQLAAGGKSIAFLRLAFLAICRPFKTFRRLRDTITDLPKGLNIPVTSLRSLGSEKELNRYE